MQSTWDIPIVATRYRYRGTSCKGWLKERPGSEEESCKVTLTGTTAKRGHRRNIKRHWGGMWGAEGQHHIEQIIVAGTGWTKHFFSVVFSVQEYFYGLVWIERPATVVKRYKYQERDELHNWWDTGLHLSCQGSSITMLRQLFRFWNRLFLWELSSILYDLTAIMTLIWEVAQFSFATLLSIGGAEKGARCHRVRVRIDRNRNRVLASLVGQSMHPIFWFLPSDFPNWKVPVVGIGERIMGLSGDLTGLWYNKDYH